MIAVKLFGATRVEIDGQALPGDALRGRPRQVLEILALAAGNPVPKDRLADLVWEGEPPVSHPGTLESYVCVLRRSLGVRSGRGSALATSAGGYVLGPEVCVDLGEFRRLVRDARTATGGRSVDAMLRAHALADGDLLHSEPYAGWAERAREVFAAEAVTAYTRTAALANATRRYDDAATLARAALGHDRLCETAWQHLIRSHWLAGRHCEALRAYAELRAVMADELGDEPGRESRELYQAILADPASSVHPAASHGELRALLRLLRQTLEAMPGVQLPALDSGLSAEAMRVLSAAS